MVFSLSLSARTFAQSEKEHFTSRLYFPFDIGYLNSPGHNLQSGIIVKMAMEYRLHRLNGWYVRFNVDNRSNSYNKNEVIGSNILKGKVKFNDYLAGIGFRFGHWHKVRQFCLLQGGIADCEYPNVLSYKDSYTLEYKHISIPEIKLSAGCEYYLQKSVALTLEIGYIWNLRSNTFDSGAIDQGALGISFGMSTNLF